VLQGVRCRLRPYAAGDAHALRAAADDPAVSRWMTAGFPSPYTLEDARAWLALATFDDPPNNFAIEADGRFAGGIGLLPQSGERDGTATFGYWLAREFWGRGIATDAARTLARHAFAERGVHRLEAMVFEPNVASARVLEKAGFVREGLLRDAYVQRDGARCHGFLYARLATDPEPQP
jgi:RimJ/RimL family protein N-acetyltransferase